MIDFTSTMTNFDKNDMVKSTWVTTPFAWSFKRFSINDDEDKRMFALFMMQCYLFDIFTKNYGYVAQGKEIVKKDSYDELDAEHKRIYKIFQHWVEYVVEGREGICLVKTDDDDWDYDFMEINFHITSSTMNEIVNHTKARYFSVIKNTKIGNYEKKSNLYED